MEETKNFILLRGLARESRHWWKFEDFLKKNIPGAKIFYLEYPGSGYRNSEIFPVDNSALLDDIHKQIEKIKLNEIGAFYLISVSLGGMVVMSYLNRYPGLFKKVFLINTSSNDLSPFYERFRPGIWWDSLKVIFSKDNYYRESHILKFTTNQLSSSSLINVAKAYAGFANEFKLSNRNILRQLFWAMKSKSPVSLINDVVFISSRYDKLCYYKCGQRLAEKLLKEFLINEEAGHDLPLDDGEWLSLNIKERL